MNNATRHDSSGIAVVGLACRYPGAQTPVELWENILGKRRQFRRIPDGRLPLAEYHNDDPQAVDKTYATRGAFIDGFEFDWVKRRIPQATFEATDLVHWLALEVAVEALDNAGYAKETINRTQAGVLLGNTLTGEFARSNSMRLRWPFIARALRAAAQQEGLDAAAIESLTATTESVFKSVFPSPNEDTLAGGMANTIAGRICNFLDLGGGGYVVDGACSSSLIAIATAADKLIAGDLDLALAGGVDLSLDPFELVGFARAGALSRGDMNVYDRRAQGFIPGEGCGFVVLKRLADAERDGDTIFARLSGWGISSDGKGGITAPSAIGQSRSLIRAYDRAGISPHELDFVEGHGTGTPVGDRAELEAISEALAHFGSLSDRRVGVTSFKSIVGHTKAAAGIGGFIKAVMSVYRRVLPPTAACHQPSAVFGEKAQALYPICHGEIRDRRDTVRAGVSSMGFGGINCHTVLESHDRGPNNEEDRRLMASGQEDEVFLIGDATVDGIERKLDALIGEARACSLAELADLSAHLAPSAARPIRVAVVAGAPSELIERLTQAKALLAETDDAEVNRSVDQKVWVSRRARRRRVGMLFPGQGSQMLNMARTPVERYRWARELFGETGAVASLVHRPSERAVDAAELDAWKGNLSQTENAQPAIVASSMVWLELLRRAGIDPDVVGGHSLGELTAFFAAGALTRSEVLGLARRRGAAMAAPADEAGTMASLRCDATTAEALLTEIEGYAVVANKNGPEQTVISGTREAIEAAIARAKSGGFAARMLQVSNAFHSRLVADAERTLLEDATVSGSVGETSCALLSCTGETVSAATELSTHFAAQVTKQVDFIRLAEEMSAQCDLVLEVGPGRVLTGLMARIAPEVICLPLEPTAESSTGLNRALAALFVHGHNLELDELFAARLIRPYVAPEDRRFITNPCERPFEMPSVEATPVLQAPPPAANDQPSGAVEMLRQVIAARTGFPAESVTADLKLLDDLNLDSIKAAEVIGETASRLGIAGEVDPSQLTNASLEEIAMAMDGAGGEAAPQETTAAEASWVRNFAVTHRAVTRTAVDPIDWRGATFSTNDPVVRRMLTARGATEQSAATHHVLRLPEARDPQIELLAEISRIGPEAESISLLSTGGGAHAFMASLHLERPDLRVRVIETDEGMDPAAHLLSELDWADDFVSARYQAEVRLEPTVRLQAPATHPPRAIDWQANDLVLVTGGGRGITAECALAFARATGVRMLLVGRSPLPRCPEAQQTLSRFAAEGLTAEYVDCDITDRTAVAALVTDRTFAGVIHGAGLNHPRPAATVTAEEARMEIAPKLDGAINLLEAIDTRSLKMFAGLTSIIGVTGMVGNAWYAYANENLDRVIAAFAAENDHCQVVSIAYSVWSDVGMGARMGSVKSLQKMGTYAVSPEEGAARFVQLMLRDPGVRQVVVAARLGGLDTWRPERGFLGEGLRFVEAVERLEPGVEVAVRAHLQADRDPYLLDHVYNGSPLFPAVFGLEAMAQAVAVLVGQKALGSVVVENARFERPIVVQDRREIEIRAQAEERTPEGALKVRVGITTEQTAFTVEHFWATFELRDFAPQATGLPIPNGVLDIEPQADLYGPLLFHGRRFQRLRRFHALTDKAQVLAVHREADEEMVLGDPYFRDALLQSLQVSIPRDLCLPVGIRRLEIPQTGGPSGELLSAVEIDGVAGKEYVATVFAQDDEGRLVERLENCELRCVDQRPNNPTAFDLADPASRDREIFQATLTGAAERLSVRMTGRVDLDHLPGIHNLPAEERHLLELPLLSRVAQSWLGHPPTNGSTICWAADGRPLLGKRKEDAISLSHDDRVTVAAAGPTPQAIDLAPVDPRDETQWRALLGNHRGELLGQLASVEPIDRAGTRVWAAVEVIRKAGIETFELRKKRSEGDAVLLTTGELDVLTVPLDLTKGGPRIFASLVETKQAEVSAPLQETSELGTFGYDPRTYQLEGAIDGAEQQPLLMMRFPVVLKHVGNPSRTVYFSHWFNWTGEVRETALYPIREALAADLTSGEYGMVTNFVSLDVKGHAHVNDVIEAAYWVGERSGHEGSTMDLHFDWRRVLPDGSRARVAYTKMQATWVKIVGHGLVEAAPCPDYLDRFLAERQQRVPGRPYAPPALPEGLDASARGPELYRAPVGPRGTLFLEGRDFDTELQESNAVGNVYFSNYGVWQGRVRDRFLHGVSPELVNGRRGGELTCVKSRVQHLREAMPFDRIRTTMRVRLLTEKSIELYFEYFRVDGERLEKLAYSTHQAIWVQQQDGHLVPAPLPDDLTRAILSRATTDVRQTA